MCVAVNILRIVMVTGSVAVPEWVTPAECSRQWGQRDAVDVREQFGGRRHTGVLCGVLAVFIIGVVELGRWNTGRQLEL